MTVELVLNPGKFPSSGPAGLGIQGETLAKLATEQLQELRRAYPLQEWPALLPNGLVLWSRLGNIEACGAETAGERAEELKNA